MKKSISDSLSDYVIVLIGFLIGFVLTILACKAYIGTKIAYTDEYGDVQVVNARSYIEDTNNNTITFEDNHNEVHNNIDNYVIINSERVYNEIIFRYRIYRTSQRYNIDINRHYF